MAGLSALSVFLKIALRNVWRARRRSVATFLTLGLCVGLSVVTLGLARGISRQLARSVVEMRTGHLQAAPRDAGSETFAMPPLPPSIRERWVVSPRLYLLGMASSRRPVLVRFSPPFPLGYELRRGRPPASACEVVADANGDGWVGVQLESSLKNCPLLTVTGSLDFAMEPAGAPPRIFAPPDAVRELAGIEGDGSTDSFAMPEISGGSPSDDDIDDLLPLEESPPQKPRGAKLVLPRQEPVFPPPAPDFVAAPVRRVRTAPVQVHAVEAKPERNFAIARSIVMGNWLPGSRPAAGEDLPAVLGAALARRLEVRIGDRVGLDVLDARGVPRDAVCRVEGIVSTQDAGIDSTALFVPLAWTASELGYADASGAPQVHEFSVLLPPGVREVDACGRLQAVLPPSLKVRTWREILPGLDSAVAFQEGLVYMILTIVLVMAVVGTLNAFVMSILERTWEFGVLKALGVRAKSLVHLILMEAFFLIAAAMAAGGAIGALACRKLERDGLDLGFLFQDGFTFAGVWLRPVWHAQFDLATVALPVAVLGGASLLAALLPALRAARMPARDALSRVE